MHKAGELATQAARAARSTASSPTQETERPLPTAGLDLIGATMTSAFGHRWTSIHGDNFAGTSGNVWAIELAGMTPAEIHRGLALARKEAWPPVLSEFKAMCKGVLPINTVELQREGDPADQSPFTVLVGRFIGYTEWKMGTPADQARMLAKAHSMAAAHVLAGGAMPAYTPAAQQLTAEDRREAPPPIMLTAEQAIATIRKELRLRPEDPEPEPVLPGVEDPKPCPRCKGTRVDPLPTAWHQDQHTKGECLQCYGSGNDAVYNRIVHEDGTTQEPEL